MIKELRQLLKKNGDDTPETSSWTSLRGPQTGVRWRGGAPPPAPKWVYANDDTGAFNKFERKVAIWQLQIKRYMTDQEAALMLYSSLQGEAEEELEHIDIKKVYSKDGCTSRGST